MEPASRFFDPVTLTEVERTVEHHLNRLESLDEVTKDDLDDFRQDLPTEPMLAEIVQLALPFPWSELFEFVEASEHQSAYWRTSHDRSAIRSVADREHKQRFARAAREARGMTGTVENSGQEIPKSAAHVANAVSGDTDDAPGTSAPGRRAVQRLRELLSEES